MRPGDPSREESAIRVGSALVLFASVLLAATWVVVFVQIAAKENDEVRHVSDSNMDIARILSEHAALALDVAAALAAEVKEHIEAGRSIADFGAKQNVGQWSGHIVQLGLADAEGRVTYSNLGPSTANIRDRAHFLAHIDKESEKPFISAPVFGRVSKRWTVQLSRRISTPKGEFAGIVVVSIDPFYYSRLFSSLDLGRNGLIASIGLDGVIRSQTVAGEEVGMGASVRSSALLESMRAKDSEVLRFQEIYGEQPWLCAFKRIPGYAMSVVIGSSEKDLRSAIGSIQREIYVAGVAMSLIVMLGAMAVLHSLRRQQRLSAALEIAYRNSTAAAHAKDRFIHMVSHEIRTPLTSIMGYSELLMNSSIVDVQREYVSQVHESAEILAKIFQKIVDVKLVEEGGISLQMSEFRIAEFLQETSLLYLNAAKAKGLLLRLEVDQDCPLLLAQGDLPRVRQVVGTLINNAIKYTESGSVVIHLSRRGRYAVVDISDTGPGMTQDSAASLFERFSLTGLASRPEGGGLGLGLMFARYLVELMGGDLVLTASDHTGTSFRLRLPLLGA